METTFEGVSLWAVKWFDNRPVTLLSTFASASPEHAGKRFDKKTRTTLYIRSKEWYRNLFFHLLDVVVVNCWLIYRRDATMASVPCKDQMTLLSFKADIACALKQQGKAAAMENTLEVRPRQYDRPVNALVSETLGAGAIDFNTLRETI
ncbi:uncharacterized protein LOC144140047 [Haemaphysalis longicornis]